MKRYISAKRSRRNLARQKELKKPFGFCCDECDQDPETKYDMRNPPFESAFVNTPLVTSRPDIQFRVQDNARPPAPIQRIVGVYRKDVEVKKAATYGRSKKGRGPLTWFLEDEIETARNMLAEEKRIRWEQMHEKKIIDSTKVQRTSDKTNTEEINGDHTSGETEAQPELKIDNNELN